MHRDFRYTTRSDSVTPKKLIGSVDRVLDSRSVPPPIPVVALPSSLLGLANLCAVTLSSKEENEREIVRLFPLTAR